MSNIKEITVLIAVVLASVTIFACSLTLVNWITEDKSASFITIEELTIESEGATIRIKGFHYQVSNRQIGRLIDIIEDIQ